MAVQPLDPNIVRIRWLCISEGNDADEARWRALLDAEELARADNFRFASDRRCFIATHALLRSMLTEATGLPAAEWRYAFTELGKPLLAAAFAQGDLQFNISHTPGAAACAIARSEIGLDIEAADRRMDFKIAHRFIAPEEASLFLSVVDEQQRRHLFFRLWTLKEAFVKATGEGLARPLDSFAFTLDPVRIHFPRRRAGRWHDSAPNSWQFAELCPVANRPLAIALRRSRSCPLQLDARAALPGEIG
jgi:4'-phosphopantetheinyl transferase